MPLAWCTPGSGISRAPLDRRGKFHLQKNLSHPFWVPTDGRPYLQPKEARPWARHFHPLFGAWSAHFNMYKHMLQVKTDWTLGESAFQPSTCLFTPALACWFTGPKAGCGSQKMGPSGAPPSLQIGQRSNVHPHQSRICTVMQLNVNTNITYYILTYILTNMQTYIHTHIYIYTYAHVCTHK